MTLKDVVARHFIDNRVRRLQRRVLRKHPWTRKASIQELRDRLPTEQALIEHLQSKSAHLSREILWQTKQKTRNTSGWE